MTKYAAEDFNANSSDSRTASSTLSEAVQSTTTLKDIQSIVAITKPADACILDREGFIACGPIVGYPRPEHPGPVKPTEPLNPPIDKLPPIYEKPMWPDKPIDPPTGKCPPNYEPLFPSEPLKPIEKQWPGKTYELLLDRSNK